MYSIVGNFSVAGIEFHWPSPNNSKTLEITIYEGKGPNEITPENLREKDKEWLMINSRSDWRINLKRLRKRFELQDDARIPDDENEILTDVIDREDRVLIQVNLDRLYGL